MQKFTDLKDIKPRNFIKGTVLVLFIVGILVLMSYYVDPGMRADVFEGSAAILVMLASYGVIGFVVGIFFPNLSYALISLLSFMFFYGAVKVGFLGATIFILGILLIIGMSLLGAVVHKKFFPNF